MSKFRPVANGEESAVIDLWARCGLTRPWNDPAKDLAFARGRENSAVLVARDGEQLIATVMTGHDGHRGTIYYLAVDPPRQRQGWGRRAVQAAEDWLKARGVWKVNLLVRSENEVVVGFYRALGYEPNDVVSLGRWLGGD
jgi:ribosomal protein S18 acetylase RimI-like enzyme